MRTFRKPFSAQTIRIFRLLLNDGRLTAGEIALRLKIFPQAVYRAIRSLENSGLVIRFGRYPTRFAILESDLAIDRYLEFQRNFFLELTKTGKGKFFPDTKAKNESIGVAFIPNREVMLRQEIEDLGRCRHNANLILSGLEAPAEVILATKRAVDRGVKVRILIQEVDSYNQEILQNLIKMGIKIRAIKFIKARIFIYDQRISYLLSYDLPTSRESIGVRLEYAPISQLLDDLFCEQWRSALNLISSTAESPLDSF